MFQNKGKTLTYTATKYGNDKQDKSKELYT